MRLVLAFALFLAACGVPIAAHSNEKRAMRIVWYGVYNMHMSPPDIVWVCNECEGHEGVCNINYQGQCFGGLYLYGHDTALVNDNRPYAMNSFSHELLHAVIRFTYGQPDPEHKRSEWKTLLPKAQQALKEAGL